MDIKNEISAGGIVFQKLTTNNQQPVTVWLICQHSFNKSWVFPKGLIGDIKKDEPMEEAALREVEEEGGIKAKIVISKPIEINYKYRWSNSSHGKIDTHEYLVNKKVYYYLMEFISGNPDNHDFEMIDAKFVSEEDVLKHLTYPAEKEAFEKILHMKKLLK